MVPLNLHHTSDAICLLCEYKAKEAHPTLREWWVPIKVRFPDAHIAWSHRGESEQEDCFQRGLTRAHWPHSKHNILPSLAIDLFELQPNGIARFDRAWFKEIALWLLAQGAPIDWGGDFKSIGDSDHFQLRPT